MKRRISYLIILILFVISCASCKKVEQKPTIAVSILPQVEATARICGNLFDVTCVVPANASPEEYEPTPKLLQKIEKSVVLFKFGLPVEDTSTIKSLTVKTINAHDKIRQLFYDKYGENDLTFGTMRDHHIWLSVRRMAIYADVVLEFLLDFDPQNAEFYTQNAQNYKDELLALYNQTIEKFENINKKYMLTDHPAFGYLTYELGLTLVSLEAEGDSTPTAIADLINIAKNNNINTFFFTQNQMSENNLAISREVENAQIIILNPLAQNYISNYKLMTSQIFEALK